ncbi:MAG: aminotransferase class IV [Bacteroidota bacterium]
MRFIESVLYRDGAYHNLSLHQERINRTFNRFMPGIESQDLLKILPKSVLKGTYKVRLVYNVDQEDVNYDLEFSEYIPRTIRSLQVMESSSFDYSFKFEDRSKINEMVAKSYADDIIITIDEKVTDGSYFNLVFWDGNKWITPDTPLLNGVRRQQLLAENKIKEVPISIADLSAFKKVSLINAMLNIGTVELLMDQVSMSFS